MNLTHQIKNIMNNQYGESIFEILSLIFMGILMIVPWFIVGLPNWGWMFIVICLTVLIWEAWSSWKKKKTISRQFWEWSVKIDSNYVGTNKWKKHPNIWKALLILASLQAGWAMLLWHLAIKLLEVLWS